MIVKQLALKFPSWFIAGAIFFGSSLIFIIWWAMRGDGEGQKKPASNGAPIAKLAYDISNVVLCGNTLVDFRSGQILAPQWLEGIGDGAPNVMKVFPKEKFVVLAGDRGMAQAFDFDGKAKPMLQVDGKPLGYAAYNGAASEVLYVRNGNLFHGKADWLSSKVESPRKLTDTGYFRRQTFQGRWLWYEDTLLVSVLGKVLRVDLGSGEIKEDQADLGLLEHGMSPSGKFVLAQIEGRELGVLDLITGEMKKHVVGQKVGKFLWLTADKAVVQVGRNQLVQYDHALKKIEGPQESEEAIRDIAEVSPDGSCFLVAGQTTIRLVDLKARKDVDLKAQYTSVGWMDDETLIGSSSAVDTASRGVWQVKKTGESKRLTNQTVDAIRSNNPALSGLVTTPGGALFVSNGDLWSYKSSSGDLKQITREQKLPPRLQFLHLQR